MAGGTLKDLLQKPRAEVGHGDESPVPGATACSHRALRLHARSRGPLNGDTVLIAGRTTAATPSLSGLCVGPGQGQVTGVERS